MTSCLGSSARDRGRSAREGPRFYRTGTAGTFRFEFADAAFRYGHSQIRHRYRINDGGGAVPMFPDLMGFDAVPETHVVDWSLLFDLPGHPPAQRAKKIDGRLTREPDRAAARRSRARSR